MLVAVLAVVVSASPMQAASTYDEAACAEAQAERTARAGSNDDDGDPDINCSEAPPAIPAVLDCNDARVSVWLGEMIGSCDMPRPQPLAAGMAAVRAGGSNGEPRLCNDGHCGVDATPIRPAARLFHDLTPGLGNHGPAAHFLSSSPLSRRAPIFLARLDGKRLERPPRH